MFLTLRHLRTAAAAASAALLLGACGASLGQAETAEDRLSTTISVVGEIGQDEAYGLRETGAATLAFVDASLEDAPMPTLAEIRVPMPSEPGALVPFELTIPRSQLREGGRYGIVAALRGSDGETLMTSDVPVPVTTGREVVSLGPLWLDKSQN